MPALLTGLLSYFILTAAVYAQSLPCLEWCRQCNAGQGCVTDCLLQDQPMRNVSCAPKTKKIQEGIACYDWCKKCKSDDKACPGRCDKQGKPFINRACPSQYGPEPLR